MNRQSKKILGLFTRYFALLLIGAGNLYVIYKLLTPLTINVVNGILSIFTATTLAGNTIHLNIIAIEIVPACVAGSAFYLLLILLISTADIKPIIRTKAIITALMTLFTLNIVRILILIPMAGASYFETVHWIFWHIISTLFVVAVWLFIIRIYKIKTIPIYSDIKYIGNLIKTKDSKRKKKHK
jgi:hypothetical protein